MRYLLFALLAAVVYALYRTMTRPRADAPTVKHETDALGLESIEVSRALPVTAPGGRSYRLVDGRCVRHRLPAFRRRVAAGQLTTAESVAPRAYRHDGRTAGFAAVRL